MRPPTSCAKCRSLKRKCIAVARGKPCQRCKRLHLDCSIKISVSASDPEPLASPSPADRSSNEAVDVFPPQELCDELVDLYFDLIHDKQHALFHRPSFIASQRNGLAPPILVSGMMALAASPFFENVHPWTRGRGWADHAKLLFDNRAEPASLTAIQACCLLSIIAFTNGDMATESLYGALAIRMVQILDFTKNLSFNRLQREIEVRVLWNIWMMDNWTAVGARLLPQVDIGHNFPKPMEEVAFDALAPDDDTSLPQLDSEFRETGMWAQMIPLTEVIGSINSLHEATVSGQIAEDDIFKRAESIAHKLDSWLLRLPKHLHPTLENLERYAAQGHGRTLVALHLGFHHHSQLLYYQFLDVGPHSFTRPDLSKTYAERCKAHAISLSNLLWLTTRLPECDCKWGIIGHLLVISSSVNLHTLLHSHHLPQTSGAKEILTHNFEMMVDLRKYWPSIDLSMSRLRSFHRACREGIRTHQMDYWMLNFLQRYMSLVDDRVPGDDGSVFPGPPPPELDLASESSNLQHGSSAPYWYWSPGTDIGNRILDTFL